MSTFKEPVKLIGSLLLVMCIGACSAETSEEMQGVLRDANHALSDAKQSIEDSGILDTSKEMLEEAKEKAAGVLPEELAKLMDPSVYLEAIGEDNLETIKAMGEGAGALLSTVRAESYEDIYNDYAEKLRREGGKLLEEYQKEAKGNLNGLEGLAEIANAKVQKLAEIDAEGTQAMASFMYAKDPEGYGAYQSWAEKLYAVYSEESEKIYGAYLSSFGG